MAAACRGGRLGVGVPAENPRSRGDSEKLLGPFGPSLLLGITKAVLVRGQYLRCNLVNDLFELGFVIIGDERVQELCEPLPRLFEVAHTSSWLVARYDGHGLTGLILLGLTQLNEINETLLNCGYLFGIALMYISFSLSDKLKRLWQPLSKYSGGYLYLFLEGFGY